MYWRGMDKWTNDLSPTLCWTRQLLCFSAWLINMIWFCSCPFPVTLSDKCVGYIENTPECHRRSTLLPSSKHILKGFEHLLGLKGPPDICVGCAGCYCFVIFLFVRCTITLPKEVCLNPSFCFRGYESQKSNQSTWIKVRKHRWLWIRTNCFLQKCFL